MSDLTQEGVNKVFLGNRDFTKTWSSLEFLCSLEQQPS